MNNFELQAKKLYNAALEGDVQSFHKLLQEDPLILDRCNPENPGYFLQSPLHVAASHGHLKFTTEILTRKPELAEEIEQTRKWCALHIAAAKGYLHIVKVLLSVNRNMCLARDFDGLNPVHVASVRGQVDVLDELLKVFPQAARERTNAGASVLHLCVQHCHVDAALKLLANVVDDFGVINFRDSDGNTVLHLAVANKQTEVVKFLLKNKKMEKNAINTNGLTAMDIHIRSRKGKDDNEIWGLLKKSKALKAKTIQKPRDKHRTWLENQRNVLMIVASLIATMAFQVGINPPGGVWQDNNDGHKAGNSIMAVADVFTQKHKIMADKSETQSQYDILLISNTIGLISSLSVILLLISGLPCKRLFVGILMIALWIAVTATTMTYLVSVSYLTGSKEFLGEPKSHQTLLVLSIVIWGFLMVILILGNTTRFIVRIIRKIIRLFVKCFKCCFPFDMRRRYIPSMA